MKTLAIAITTALISSSVVASNTATTTLENSNNDTISILQVSPADGSEAIVDLSQSSNSNVVIHQEHDKNFAQLVGSDSVHSSDVGIYQNGLENVTNVTLTAVTGTDVDVDLYGNENQVTIAVSESDNNRVTSEVGKSSDLASHNKLAVNIDSLSHSNAITTSQMTTENTIDINISDASEGNSVYASQNAELNQVDVDINEGSGQNVIEIVQVSHRSNANVALTDNSVGNTIDLTQSISDVANISLTNATNSSINVVQY